VFHPRAAKARGVKLRGFRGVLPTAEHHHMAVQAKKAAAAARAADLASLIRDIREVGATSHRAIARELDAREVPAAGGGAGARKRREFFPLQRHPEHTRLRSENSRPIAAPICATSLAARSRSSRAISDACRLAGTVMAGAGTAAAVRRASPSLPASSTALVISSANNGMPSVRSMYPAGRSPE